jgi:hypothetical protein
MHVFWRRAASDCAKQDFVQSLMKANPQREWRQRAQSHAPTEKLAASYPDYIRQQEVWGNTFDVALLAWCIERQHDIVRPDARSRLVVFDCREGAHVPCRRHRRRATPGVIFDARGWAWTFSSSPRAAQ